MEVERSPARRGSVVRAAALFVFLVPASAPAQDVWVDVPILRALADGKKVSLQGQVNTGPGWTFRLDVKRVEGVTTLKLQGKAPAVLGTKAQGANLTYTYTKEDKVIAYKVGGVEQRIILGP